MLVDVTSIDIAALGRLCNSTKLTSSAKEKMVSAQEAGT
jgi:hypothetical protein